MSQKSSNKKRAVKKAATTLTPQLPTSERQEMEPRKLGRQTARTFTMPRASPVQHAVSLPRASSTTRAVPAPHAGPAQRSVSASRTASAPGKVSVPLIRPSDDASKPAPRVMMDKEAIESQGKRWGLHQQSAQEAEAAKKAHTQPTAKAKGDKTTGGPIHKDMLISDIMLNYPQTLDILMAIGLHCIGCQLSAYDTLESGCALHGMDEATIAELVKQMNAKLKA